MFSQFLKLNYFIYLPNSCKNLNLIHGFDENNIKKNNNETANTIYNVCQEIAIIQDALNIKLDFLTQHNI